MEIGPEGLGAGRSEKPGAGQIITGIGRILGKNLRALLGPR
jgi:hypothetical protein